MSRLIRAMALVGASMLLASACGGAAAESTTPTLPTLREEPAAAAEATTTTEAVDAEEALQDYTACMQEHGIELPDPGSTGAVIEVGGEDFDIESFDEAAAECDPILEAAFGEFELSPEQQAEMMDQELALAQCMRDNGVDWPDPNGDGNVTIELGDDVDPESVNAAMDVCMKEAFGDTGGIIVGGGTP
jgi:hypothetical protein